MTNGFSAFTLYICATANILSLSFDLMSERSSGNFYMFLAIKFFIRTDSRRSQTIRIDAQARGHPLFPILDYTARASIKQDQQLANMEQRLAGFETDIKKMQQMQKELNDLMKQHLKKTYKLTNEGFDVSSLTHIIL